MFTRYLTTISIKPVNDSTGVDTKLSTEDFNEVFDNFSGAYFLKAIPR
jgi:hypothetical protein